MGRPETAEKLKKIIVDISELETENLLDNDLRIVSMAIELKRQDLVFEPKLKEIDNPPVTPEV